MKKLSIFAIVLAAVCSVACIKSEESYFTPYEASLYIQIRDASGELDLLDPNTEGHWPDSLIYCQFRGETYYANDTTDTEYEKTHIANGKRPFIGLARDAVYDVGYTKRVNVLFFGCLPGDVDYEEDIVFFFPDKTKDTLHLHNKCLWVASRQGVSNQELSVKVGEKYYFPWGIGITGKSPYVKEEEKPED